LVLTGCIVAFGTIFGVCTAVFQVGIIRENNRTTAEQIEKLIQAANIQASAAAKNAQAAADFAHTADEVNRHTNEAVGELDRLAKGSEHSVRTIQVQAANALNATIEASKADQRAWFGISEFEVLHYDPSDSNTPFRMQVTFRNSGKTPALHIRFASWMWATDSLVDGPSEAQLRELEVYMKTIKVRYVAAPGASRKVIILDNGTSRNMVTSNYQDIQNRKRFFYVFGQVDYDDVYQRSHTTRFCLWLAEPETKQLAHCQNDNEMN
jgi:hypothetical protein